MSQAADHAKYVPELEWFDYPYEVKRYKFTSQGTDVQMDLPGGQIRKRRAPTRRSASRPQTDLAMAFRYQSLVVFQVQILRRVNALPITRDYMVDGEQRLLEQDVIDARPRLVDQ